MLKLKTWARAVRAPFLLLSLVLVPVGVAAAWWEAGVFSLARSLWTLAGLVLAHISVNLLNEYSDYRTGIDLRTVKTPFSGGSGVLPAGFLQPAAVYRLALAALLGAFAIGLYLAILSGPLLLILIFAGGAMIYFYTTHLARWGAGELVAGLGLGSLPVMGAYFVQSGSFSLASVVAGLAPGFLTSNLLLLNEFPDAEADRRGGRAHLVILLGKRRAAYIYVTLLCATYLSIIGSAASAIAPRWCLLGLLSLPLAWRAGHIALQQQDDLSGLIPALAANVQTILGTDLLLALGYFLGGALG
ncbi:MAG: prenyltransferase [Candidatus Acetothermia bacterium]|nr:prenyltransferase [Candidatus Acetothermia bacterium]MDH7505067.1 prenyltransferase [Candidatus Acetothermia bacterium]